MAILKFPLSIHLRGQNGDSGGFSAEQVEMYKTCFGMMDFDKDGTISKTDLRAALTRAITAALVGLKPMTFRCQIQCNILAIY